MSYGSNDAVNDAEDKYREQCAELIANKAAALVAARDMSRADAVSAIAEWLREDNAADSDPSRVRAIENKFPSPSKAVSSAQVAAIAVELMEAAQDAADSL